MRLLKTWRQDFFQILNFEILTVTLRAHLLWNPVAFFLELHKENIVPVEMENMLMKYQFVYETSYIDSP